MKIRKQINELTPKDFSRFPVWEYALDEENETGQDECTVRPYKFSGALDVRKGTFIVRTLFTLADGSTFLGYLASPLGAKSRNDLGTLHPVIVTQRGQVGFWRGILAPKATQLKRDYYLLGRNAPQVFPIQFKSDVTLVGGEVFGSIPGFLVLEDFRTEKTRIVI